MVKLPKKRGPSQTACFEPCKALAARRLGRIALRQQSLAYIGVQHLSKSA